MKKKILGAIFVIAIVCVGGYNVYQAQKRIPLSALNLANIEALAQDETEGGYCSMHISCYDKHGKPTGLYSATCFWSPNCKGTYHSHSCSSCSHN